MKVTNKQIQEAVYYIKNKKLSNRINPKILAEASNDLRTSLDNAILEVKKIFDGREASVFEKIKNTLSKQQIV